VVAWAQDKFSDFYLVENHKIANNSTDTKTREKISRDLKSLEFWKFFDVCMTKFKNNQFLFYKISQRLLLTMKLFIGSMIFIGKG
jgi:hypothetical protein